MHPVLHAAAMLSREHSEPGLVRIRHPVAVGALRIHAYALCILAGIIAGSADVRPLGAARGTGGASGTSPSGPSRSASSAAGSTTCSTPEKYFGPASTAPATCADPADLARRPGHLGRRSSASSAPGSAAAAPASAHRLRGRRGPGAAAGPGHRPLGELLQPGALRRPTTLPWGLQIDVTNPNFPAGMPADTLFHPTFLYESLWMHPFLPLVLAVCRSECRFSRPQCLSGSTDAPWCPFVSWWFLRIPLGGRQGRMAIFRAERVRSEDRGDGGAEADLVSGGPYLEITEIADRVMKRGRAGAAVRERRRARDPAADQRLRLASGA